uniref:NADH-ubiquinone oxidoreductase chain 2 n=1 Tax=Heterodermia casarettiana TaxID=365009 RepID=A0A482JW97_9LECA|nr:NADH dehydrogenase subunit 2 [Heterodermia casarettiana]QBP39514.1 NADH dehydrogenase subunit 2 [Heterodermia casarettiana]
MLFYYIVLLLSSNAVSIRRDKSILYCRVAIVMLIYAFINASNLNVAFSYKGIGLYGGLYTATNITQTFHMFIIAICVIILQLTAFYPRKLWLHDIWSSTIFWPMRSVFTYNNTNVINKMGEQFRIIEYPLILLFIITGSILLVSSSDLVSIFLSIELQSYGLYLLSTIYRNSELSTSAGLTYFLLGGLSSCFILLSTSLIYANSGLTNMDGIYVLTSLPSSTQDKSALIGLKPFYLNMSLLIMSVGFLFKVSSVPFHFWSPDVYDAIPTIVTTFVAIVAKISILVFFLELVHYTNNSYFPLNFSWRSSLLLSSLLSLIIGSVLGLTQLRIKRLFAYSTISHLGFILLALAVNSIESIQAFIFYLMQYSVSNLNAFLIVISIGYSLYPYIYSSVSQQQDKNLLDKNYSPIQLISEIKGYYYLNSYLALCLSVTLFSLVGIPPLMGFFAKQMVLSSALDSGYVFITLVAILTSVISAVYYLGVIKQIFFDENEYILSRNVTELSYTCKVKSLFLVRSYLFPMCIDDTNMNTSYLNIFTSYLNIFTLYEDMYDDKFTIHNVVLSNYLTITISILTLLLVLFVFTPQEILSMANILALILFNS